MALKQGPMKDRVCLYTPSEYANGFSSWPDEDFALFSPMGGCPSGLQEGVVGHKANKYFTSESYHLATEFEENVFSSKICKHKKSEGHKKETLVKPVTMWEPGHYCILKKRSKVSRRYSNFENINRFKEGSIKSDKSDGLVLEFCCRQDGSTLDHMILPNREPIVLMKKDRKSCQAIKDMESKEEWYLVRAESEKPFTFTGETPFTRKAGEASLYFYFCYYWPINYDCGDIITLTSENPTVQIQSPNYPQSYNDKQVCAWTILSPPDTQMILNFDYFDVEAGDDDTCIDALEVRFSMPGQPGINYCGENFNFTTVSEENYLGLIFTTDTAGQRQGFSASIKLLTKPELCYTGKGEDYRGTVNVTRRFEPCLPWSQVQDCPHHMFHLKDLDDGLLHNYCRNPGDGTRPWCYTHADECLRNYCDVCNIESCYDVFDDCPGQASKNPNYCTEDEEARRGCAKYCGYCNSVSPPAVSNVQCGAPDDVLDSTPMEALKQVYNVGDEVTYKCNTGTEKEIRRYDGGTSCPSGWIPYQDKCYKWFDVLQDKSGAHEFCKQYDAHLATAKDADEHAFLVEARRYARNVWLGLEYNKKLKGHYWEDDDSLVTWGNWKTEVKICTDARSDCDEIISSEPGACLDFQYFAKQVCPESCGLCINGKGNTCKKDKEQSHVIELTGMKEIRVGQIFEYTCEDGYIMKDGNLRQACLKNGQLTGEPPTCVDKIVDRNNIVEIRERRLDVKSNIAVTALNDEMRIHKNGQIVAWEFYSLYSGEVTFQIWRPDRHKSKDYFKSFIDLFKLFSCNCFVTACNGDYRNIGSRMAAWLQTTSSRGAQNSHLIPALRHAFLLVGQNTISDTEDDRKSKRTVDKKDQISVLQGDLIGIYVATDTMSGMTYDKCVTDYADGDSGNQLQCDSEVLSAQDWVVGQNYNFKSAKEDCKVFSVTAYVN
ncbi:hypothetical protein KUTeg_016419 [Tegillarca granosa]|uniref:Uncharacterized protein n=1 Tax=Tegillarca granosa TaxID=220873 RepID=A0ABQ9EKU3_TEGGR|nr:hypothetical protein KUTeg_016419 [Tegillarca granosa]